MVEVIPQLNISPWQDATLWVEHRIARGRTHFGPLSLPLSYMLTRNGCAMNKIKSIPKFRSEAEERRFWETHDSSDYVDWSKAKRVRFPNLKPSTTSISLRLPVMLLERIKVAANKRDVPYQSLIKTCLAEKTTNKRGSSR
jgi:predicted DNA binding CopG/RHH family protein